MTLKRRPKSRSLRVARAQLYELFPLAFPLEGCCDGGFGEGRPEDGVASEWSKRMKSSRMRSSKGVLETI
ncbi:MAG TPA: hypothetical protein P5102_16010 [Candidatus Competibacteraceae bacterium]|nr:hypothetical protein [Candidatus Competibacteraceae bacterium]HSA48052.1 hypothetical protein [Candidatus Competibacteraceae bacterium]